MFFKKNNSGSAVDFIVVGLGNPGSEYENTRHNAGFMALDTIAKELNIKIDRVKFKALTTVTNVSGKKVLFMKPTTFMNLSGQAVVAAMEFYKVPIENVLVIFDDISLEPGKLRIRQKGSHGGHNGIKSIALLTGYDTFPRIKIGVGNKPNPDYDLANWVLGHFNKDQLKDVQSALDKCPDIVSLIIDGRIGEAMNKYN